MNRAKFNSCSWQDIKYMLQLYPSSGKFFMNFAYAEFQLKEDAVWFTLRWS